MQTDEAEQGQVVERSQAGEAERMPADDAAEAELRDQQRAQMEEEIPKLISEPDSTRPYVFFGRFCRALGRGQVATTRNWVPSQPRQAPEAARGLRG